MNKRRQLIQKISFVIVAISLGIVLGFYFKKPDTILIEHLISLDAEWKKDLYIEFMKSGIPFFYLETDNAQRVIEVLGKFKFNWFAFLAGLFFIYLNYLINKYFEFIGKGRILALIKRWVKIKDV